MLYERAIVQATSGIGSLKKLSASLIEGYALSCLDFVEPWRVGEPREMWDEVGSSQPLIFVDTYFCMYVGSGGMRGMCVSCQYRKLATLKTRFQRILVCVNVLPEIKISESQTSPVLPN